MLIVGLSGKILVSEWAKKKGMNILTAFIRDIYGVQYLYVTQNLTIMIFELPAFGADF